MQVKIFIPAQKTSPPSLCRLHFELQTVVETERKRGQKGQSRIFCSESQTVQTLVSFYFSSLVLLYFYSPGFKKHYYGTEKHVDPLQQRDLSTDLRDFYFSSVFPFFITSYFITEANRPTFQNLIKCTTVILIDELPSSL